MLVIIVHKRNNFLFQYHLAIITVFTGNVLGAVNTEVSCYTNEEVGKLC